MFFKFHQLRLVFALLLAAPFGWAHAQSLAAQDLTRFVDPRIGVVGSGSCVIGPALPFASVHPSPDTPKGGHDGYAPDQPIRGFSQTHVSGTGWGQYGNILVSPQVGLAVGETEHDSPKAEERATAYDYRVRLTKYDVLSEFTPAAHSVFYQFTYPKSDEASLLFDVGHSIGKDIVPDIQGQIIDGQVNWSKGERSVSGYGAYQGGFVWGIYKIYFYAELDRVPSAVGTWKNGQISDGVSDVKADKAEERVGGFARFRTDAGDVVKLKIGISFQNVEAARANLQRELPNWDYVGARDKARQTWNRALSVIRVDEPDEMQKTLFYTALYHAQIMPRDRTGEFVRFAPNAPMWDDHYAVWDTWRTLYPLMTLLRPDMVRGTIQGFIERGRVDKSVNDTFVAGNNGGDEQGGNDIDNIIADAYVKKVRGIDWNAAYRVLKFNADSRREGLSRQPELRNTYREQGWLPTSIMSASFTLEYAYNDFCAGQVAAGLGFNADAEKYFARSKGWENLWNPNAQSDGFKGFITPKTAIGEWPDHDVKAFGGSWKGDFYEGSSWTYSYFVPHQPARLVELMGGPETFARRLDYGMQNGLIDFSNEPAFLAPQLFHYAGRPDLSAKWIRQITAKSFTLQGYPGDDDSGAMSSYYVWSRIGLFPNAGQDIYYLNAPILGRVVVERPEDGPLTVSRTGAGDYIASATLNGKPLGRSWVRHAELKGRTKLAFTMSKTPTKWGQPNGAFH